MAGQNPDDFPEYESPSEGLVWTDADGEDLVVQLRSSPLVHKVTSEKPN